MPDEPLPPTQTPSKFFDVFFQTFSYPLASAIVRAIKVFLSILLPAVFAALIDGTLLKDVRVIPQGYIPLLTAVISPSIIAFEKYLREHKIIEDQSKNPISLDGDGPLPEEIVVTPDTNRPLE